MESNVVLMCIMLCLKTREEYSSGRAGRGMCVEFKLYRHYTVAAHRATMNALERNKRTLCSAIDSEDVLAASSGPEYLIKRSSNPRWSKITLVYLAASIPTTILPSAHACHIDAGTSCLADGCVSKPPTEVS